MQVERQVLDVVLELGLRLVTEAADDADHRGVLGKYVGHEAAHAATPGHARQVFDQQRADAGVLLVVVDEQRELGRDGVEPLERRNADQLVVDEGNQRLVLGVRRPQ